MKILLIQPFKDFGIFGDSYPPIGLGYIATSLRKSGHSVYILDCLKNNYNYKGFIEKVKIISPDMIGFTLFSISVPFVKKMIDMVREERSKIMIVLGGPHVSSLPYKILHDFEKVDFAIRGEGEVPMRHLADSISAGKEAFSEIPGLIYRRKDQVLVNDPYFAKDVEEYDFPAWDLINPPEYYKYLGLGPNTIPVILSRGCPFPCTFCAAKVTSGQMLRRRSLDHIFKELHLLKEMYDIKRFIIEDEGFGVTKRFIKEFCERFRREGLKATIALGLGMRLDVIDEELLTEMKKSSFEKRIVVGIESGSERVLKLMKKNINLKMIYEKINLMAKMGFTPTGYFILGYPTETKEEMEETIRLALRLPIIEASFTAFQPLPATEATNALIKNKELPEDFDFTLLAQNKVAYAPKGITSKELARIRERAILRFYLRPRTILPYFVSYRAFLYAIKKVIAVFLKPNVIQEPLINGKNDDCNRR